LININDKAWDKLKVKDIYELLKEDDEETFFFEYKSDKVTPKKIIEEISAFANTYGGYILLGVEDDKTITGCDSWNEQRIHNTIHNCITPIPSFDVKKFKTEDTKVIYIIKIDEGVLPPYITNTGKIYERVSSGSFPINDSVKLTQLYYRREDQFKKIDNKITIEDFNLQNIPNNFCGYLDLGFSLTINDLLKFQKSFFNIDLGEISKVIKEKNSAYSISRVGYSIVISIGSAESKINEKVVLCNAGLHNFIEIMCDGSIKCRVVLCANNDNKVKINQLLFIPEDFAKIYELIVGENFYKSFVNAYKYEKLTVFKQFVPYLHFETEENDKYTKLLNEASNKHIEKYGNNLIITGNRIPKNGFNCIDKKYFSNYKLAFNNKNLIHELFYIEHLFLGFIDNITSEDE